MIERSVFEARLDQLRADQERAKAQTIALDGAIQQCEWTLELYDKQVEEVDPRSASSTDGAVKDEEVT